MRKASEYRDHAQECRTLAANAKADQRAMLLHMAETWEALAVSREAQVQRVQRLDTFHRPTK